ncbi:MAG: hypothetical protein ABIL09_16555 [Gemmatimonadota bacterium]
MPEAGGAATGRPVTGTRPRLYVDLDDVLCATAELLIARLEAEHGRRVEIESVRDFDLSVSFGLGREELAAFMGRAHTPEALAAYPERAGARAGMEAWRRAGYELWVVTGRPAASHAGTRQWLTDSGLPWDELVFVDKYRDYDRSNGAGDSAEVRPLRVEELAGLGFRAAVEDSAEMAARLAGELGLRVLLLDRPWNRGLAAAPGKVERCRDWADLMARFPRP